MERIAVFGAGEGGRRVVRALNSSVLIVGVLDNDPKKHGTEVAGVRVYAPCDLPSLACDGVVIASVHAAQIYRQLRDMGIDESMIHVPPESVMQPVPRAAWRALAALVLVFGCGVGLGVLLALGVA
jgi:FlaA1/EpsC-like NDP-sugar epimerase